MHKQGLVVGGDCAIQIERIVGQLAPDQLVFFKRGDDVPNGLCNF